MEQENRKRADWLRRSRAGLMRLIRSKCVDEQRKETQSKQKTKNPENTISRFKKALNA